MNNNISIPWTEKYRPTDFEQIVLSDINKKILDNIIKLKIFPNLMFYGPPGTGKTTTIINLIKKYQDTHNEVGKDFIIHLNASDDRGIDIIRNQISQFVNSKTLFKSGLKFVILDEVDYMTKNAQKALCYLLQNYQKNVRFCLICNYISKIDTSLQGEFIHLRFNKLPEKHIINYLKRICLEENIKITNNQIQQIYEMYVYDIRSMINYIQMNQNKISKIINNNMLDKIFNYVMENTLKKSYNYINNICITYNIESNQLSKKLFSFLLENKTIKTGKLSEFLSDIEVILHNRTNVSNDITTNYMITVINKYY